MSKQQKNFTPVIAVTGLESAGKTTLINRLKTGEFVEHFRPTIGFEISFMYVGDTRFDIVDLGGQLAFRKTFWKNFVSTCQGCIFVFDRADPSKISVAKEWLWKIEDWLPKDAVIAFLANKSDLEESMELEELVEELNLVKFSSTVHSFRIFETSSLSGVNLQECWDWITSSILRRIETKKRVNIKAFELYDDRIETISQIITTPEEETTNLKKAMEVFHTHSLKMIDDVPYISIEDYVLIVLRKGDFYAVLYVDREDDLGMAREYGLAIMFEALARYKRELPLDKDFLHQVISSLEY
ncbi:MAG: ADP-ribosylation factor-like protein [Candidatus Heimdallarchaeaceae archaeon]